MAVYDMTNRRSAAKKTKEKIYKAALKLFRKKGYDNVTIVDITREANVAKGSFYTYFNSKDDVLVRTFKEIDEYYATALEEADANVGAGERFIIFGKAMCRYVRDSFGVNYTKVVYQNQIGLNKRQSILNNKTRPFYVLLADIAQQGKNSGEFRADIPDEQMVLWMARLLHGLLYDWCLYDGEFDLMEEGDRYFRQAIKLLSAK